MIIHCMRLCVPLRVSIRIKVLEMVILGMPVISSRYSLFLTFPRGAYYVRQCNSSFSEI